MRNGDRGLVEGEEGGLVSEQGMTTTGGVCICVALLLLCVHVNYMCERSYRDVLICVGKRPCRNGG